MKNLLLHFIDWLWGTLGGILTHIVTRFATAGCMAAFGIMAYRRRKKSEMRDVIVQMFSYPLVVVLQLLQEHECTGVWTDYELVRLEQIVQRDLRPAVLTLINKIGTVRKDVVRMFGEGCLKKIDLSIGSLNKVASWTCRGARYEELRTWGIGVLQSWIEIIDSMRIRKKDKREINAYMQDCCNGRGIEWISDFQRMLTS